MAQWPAARARFSAPAQDRPAQDSVQRPAVQGKGPTTATPGHALTDAAAMFIYLESIRYQGDDIGALPFFHLDLGAPAAGPAEPIRVRARHGATRMIHRPLARVEVPAGSSTGPSPCGCGWPTRGPPPRSGSGG